MLLVIPAVGAVLGAAEADPASLVQPDTVCVMVYVPALVTIIGEVVSPVLHNNVPDADVESVDVPLQLLVTFIDGVAGIEFTVNVAAFEFTVPFTFVNTARY